MFLRFIFFVVLVYNATLRYENVNKNIRLFVCVSVTVQVAVTSVQARSKRNTNCMHGEYISVTSKVDKRLSE